MVAACLATASFLSVGPMMTLVISLIRLVAPAADGEQRERLERLRTTRWYTRLETDLVRRG